MKTYFEQGDWLVTSELLRTPKKTFTLEKLEGVSLRRNLFMVMGIPAGGVPILTLLFWPYLYFGEIAFLLTASIAALTTSYVVGVFKVEALSLKDEEGGVVYGWFPLLSDVRAALEQAFEERGQGKGEKS
jgi:hypothetical protein